MEEQEVRKKIEQAMEAIGLSTEDKIKALELAKFLIRIGTIDIGKLPIGPRAGDTVCNSGC